MKVKTNSGVTITDINNAFGMVYSDIQGAIDITMASPLSAFTDEELVAELLRRTSLGKELE